MRIAERGTSRPTTLTQRRRSPERAKGNCASAPLREISLSLLAACCLFVLLFTGCGLLHRGRGFAGSGPLQNPLFIPPVDRELLWNQTVDAVDDYFRIERED